MLYFRLIKSSVGKLLNMIACSISYISIDSVQWLHCLVWIVWDLKTGIKRFAAMNCGLSQDIILFKN